LTGFTFAPVHCGEAGLFEDILDVLVLSSSYQCLVITVAKEVFDAQASIQCTWVVTILKEVDGDIPIKD
jgi:hypothetical protein